MNASSIGVKISFYYPPVAVVNNSSEKLQRLVNSWIDETPLKDFSFKAIMVMPALLLQKPSRTSKK